MSQHHSAFICASLLLFTTQIVSAESVCGNCRSSHSDRANFCSNCGTKLPKEKAMKKSPLLEKERELTYDGKTLNDWIEILRGSDKEAHNKAITAVREIGVKGAAASNLSIAALKKASNCDDPALQTAAKKALVKIMAERNRSSKKPKLASKSNYSRALEMMREAIKDYRKAKNDKKLIRDSRMKFTAAKLLFDLALIEAKSEEKPEVQSFIEECKQYIYDCRKRE